MGENDLPPGLGSGQEQGAAEGPIGDLSATVNQQADVKKGNTMFAGDRIQKPGQIYIGPKGARGADPDAYFQTKHYPPAVK